MTLIKVNGVAMPTPTADGYSINRYDLDGSSTGRGEDGIMFRDRVRGGIYKIELTWQLTMEELTKVVSAISPESFTVEFFDITTCSYVSRTMYAGDRSGKVLNYIDEDSPQDAMCELTCNFVEL
jgi:hypothetical protein